MKKKYKHLFYFIVGEPSGDLHASFILKNLKRLNKNIYFRGLGGPLMEKEGLEVVCDYNKLVVMGFFEVFKRISFFLKLKKKVVEDIKKVNPSVLVLVDYPGFNLKIAKELKEINKNIKIIYYISPQLWAWKEKRINIIKKYIDKMVVLFPFEVNWYKERGVSVKYFGHPLVDLAKKKTVYKKNSSLKTVGLFPGSRAQEIKKHLPVLKKFVELANKNIKNIHFIVGLAENIDERCLKNLNLKNNHTIVKNNSLKAFDLSDIAVVASGTATLECALTKTPCLVIYKTSWVSWMIATFFMKTKHISIVNILANKLIYKELLQKNCSGRLIYNNVFSFFDDKFAFNIKKLDSVVDSLGTGKAYIKTSKYILKNVV